MHLQRLTVLLANHTYTGATAIVRVDTHLCLTPPRPPDLTCHLTSPGLTCQFISRLTYLAPYLISLCLISFTLISSPLISLVSLCFHFASLRISSFHFTSLLSTFLQATSLIAGIAQTQLTRYLCTSKHARCMCELARAWLAAAIPLSSTKSILLILTITIH